MIQIQIFLKILKPFLDDTKFEEFVSRLFRVIQTLKNRAGRGGYAAPVSRLIFSSPSPKPMPTLGQTFAPHPKRSNEST